MPNASNGIDSKPPIRLLFIIHLQVCAYHLLTIAGPFQRYHFGSQGPFWLNPAASSIIQHHHRKLERQRQRYLKMMFQSYPARNSWKDNDRLCRRWSKKWHWLYWGNSKLLDLSCIFFATKQNRQRMSTSFSFDITLMAMGHPQYHHIWLNWNLRSSCVKHGISVTK
jgi:hypothetical protein